MTVKATIKICTYKSIWKHPFYTEGPVMDTAGNLYFTNLAGGAINRISTNGTETIWATTDCPNGQVILSNGHHLVCDSKTASLVKFDWEGKFLARMINGFCAGEKISVPNDVIEDSNGNIYFTDSVRNEGKIARINSSGEETIIAKELDYPNGLALSADEKILFVAESYQNRIISFKIHGENLNTNAMKVIAELPKHSSDKITDNLPDGLKIDEEGNIWVAHYGMGMVHQLRASGEILQSIKLPFDLVSNLFIHHNKIIVTGGYGEPGPGAIIEIEL